MAGNIAVALLLFGLAGTVGIFSLMVRRRKGRVLERASWSKVTGAVISSKVTVRPEDNNVDLNAQDDWVIDVRFSYAVGGTGYSGKQKWIASWPGAAYAPGDRIDIYYNPSRPNQAVVVREYVSANWLLRGLWIISLGAFLVGLWSFAASCHV